MTVKRTTCLLLNAFTVLTPLQIQNVHASCLLHMALSTWAQSLHGLKQYLHTIHRTRSLKLLPPTHGVTVCAHAIASHAAERHATAWIQPFRIIIKWCNLCPNMRGLQNALETHHTIKSMPFKPCAVLGVIMNDSYRNAVSYRKAVQETVGAQFIYLACLKSDISPTHHERRTGQATMHCNASMEQHLRS